MKYYAVTRWAFWDTIFNLSWVLVTAVLQALGIRFPWWFFATMIFLLAATIFGLLRGRRHHMTLTIEERWREEVVS